MEEETKNLIEGLTKRITALEGLVLKTTELENRASLHQHYGYDGSSKLDGNVRLKPSSYFNDGKLSFTDSTNAGYFISSAGLYFGSASDVTKLKYNIANGTLDYVGTISSKSTADIVAAFGTGVNTSNLITDLINARLNTSAKTILSDFTFSPSDYSGAFKTGDIAWNTTTGAITGGTGIVINKLGILGASAGVTKFSILTDGNATFAGTLSAASGTLGAITIGSNAWQVDSSGNMWWGSSTTYAGATYKISAAGVANLSGLVVGTNVGLGTAQDSSGVTTIIGNTVTTGFVNALSVTAGSVAAENITGTTITGKTIETSSSGIRTVINGSTDYIEFKNGTTLYAQLYPYAFPGGGGIVFETSDTNTGAQLILQYGNVDGGGLTFNGSGLWVDSTGVSVDSKFQLPVGTNLY